MAPDGLSGGPGTVRAAAPAVATGMICGRIAAALRGVAEPWYNEPNDHRSWRCAARCRR